MAKTKRKTKRVKRRAPREKGAPMKAPAKLDSRYAPRSEKGATRVAVTYRLDPELTAAVSAASKARAVTQTRIVEDCLAYALARLDDALRLDRSGLEPAPTIASIFD